MKGEDKVAIRRQVAARLSALSSDEAKRQTAALSRFLEVWAYQQGFEVVLATLPLSGEPDLTPWLSDWLASGRRVALARTGPGRRLDFGFVDDLKGPWNLRPFGMREPGLEARAWTAGPPTLVLVPGVAFAPASAGGALRLGHGAGYYDRWLAVHASSVFTLGVGFSVQTLDHLPTEAHDEKLDAWWDGERLRT